MTKTPIRRRTVHLKKWCVFPPFRVPARGRRLDALDLPPDLELIRVARGGEQRLLIVREMAYHHVAQGVLGGEPFLVSF